VEQDFSFYSKADRMYSLLCISQANSPHVAKRTITIDRTMGAWLLSIALDLFPSTFVASPSDAAALLERRWGAWRLRCC
jgi:hypothetical protein